MYRIFIFTIIIAVCISCATSSPHQGNIEIAPPQVELTPLQEQEIQDIPEEYDLIIDMCTGMFSSYGTGVTTFCILRNFYAMNHVDRMAIEGKVTKEKFKKCHKPEFYFPEYETFWYGDVWKCLQGEEDYDTNDD